MNFGINKKCLTGRKKIQIPVNEITKEVIEEYLPQIMATFYENCEEIKYLKEYKNGKQDILNKTRQVQESINNKVVENHAFNIVEFVKGYLVGNPIQITQRLSSELTDEVTYLNTYMKDVNKAKKDTLTVENIVTYGKSLYLTLPKVEGVENIEKESPYDIYQIDGTEGDVIYSSMLNKSKIGCFVITEVKDSKSKKTIKLVTIYTKSAKYLVYLDNVKAKGKYEIKQEEFILPFVPMTEYYFFESRIGLIEVVLSTLNLLNRISSNEIDDIEQFVNNIIVLINQDITQEDVKFLRENKLLKMKSTNPQFPADVKFLQQALSHGDINNFYNRVYVMMMNIVAIPKSSDNATSGGDTGQARLLGEGWTLADQRAMTYENMFEASELENMKVALYICRQILKCPIKNLYSSDLKVTFNINKSDNMLVKSQTMLNLNTLNLPKEIIAEKSQLFNDPIEVAKIWEEYDINNEKNISINNQDNRTK